MTDRQITGVWFVATGILLLSLYIFSFAIVNLAIDSGFMSLGQNTLSNEQLYVIGASGVFAVQLASITGVPLIITGLAQIVTGKQKTKKKAKK